MHNGTKITANYGGIDYPLAKIVGSKAMSLGNAKISSNLTGATHQWYRRRYYYRVDKAYENQEFSNTESYLDTASHQLNATGYGNARTVKDFGIKEESDTFRLISFTDLFTALETSIDPSNNNLAQSDVSKELKKIFTDTNRYEITSLEYYGHASYQGRRTSNNTLARNRANTLKKWLEGFSEFSGVESKQPQIKNQSEKPVTNVGHNSDLDVKLWRSASVIINYTETTVTNAGVTNTSSAVTKVEIPNKTQSNKIRVGSVHDWLKTPNGQKFEAKMIERGLNYTDLTWEIVEKYNDVNFNDPNSWDYDDFKNNSGITVTEPKEVERYDNEGEFFELLTRESPFLHHLISDKIKYFDPAYHSISPEGFGARLTFLHQCTRQGSTIENGSVGEVSAYNLAFGRPPVCILRLGDFYYTKIIINSLTINYDNPQWDLNPEGIGVMPMFAKISINFTFLGGSDLAGPIARLQNAVSFNYYANTSVYDNRAEMVEYDKEGRGIETKFKGFTYPSPKNK
jgi:outer membrane protein OmpA-like peptidoglycan-associated protein